MVLDIVFQSWRKNVVRDNASSFRVRPYQRLESGSRTSVASGPETRGDTYNPLACKNHTKHRSYFRAIKCIIEDEKQAFRLALIKRAALTAYL